MRQVNNQVVEESWKHRHPLVSGESWQIPVNPEDLSQQLWMEASPSMRRGSQEYQDSISEAGQVSSYCCCIGKVQEESPVLGGGVDDSLITIPHTNPQLREDKSAWLVALAHNNVTCP